MSQRTTLPQTEGGVFLTDAGLETVLIFHDGIDLPAFASFPLVEDDAGREALNGYYAPFLHLARERGDGLRPQLADLAGEPGLGRRAGLRRRDAWRRSTASRSTMLERLRADAGAGQPILIEGMLGPRGDGYAPSLDDDGVGRGALPRRAAAGVRRHRRRHGVRDHDDVRRARRSGSSGRPRRSGCRRRSASRSRPTAGCPAARRCGRRSTRSTPRPTVRADTS